MTRHSILMIALLLGTGACAAEQAVSFQGMRSEVPSGWTRDTPSSGMRLLQFGVPAAGGGEGAQFVVFYFGPGQGGSLEANVERWTAQFSNPDGSPVTPVIGPVESPMPATLVELRGSYARGVGAGPGAESVPDRMLLAAVVETPAGNLYPQLHGPAELVASQREAFIAFIQGIQAAGSP
jgi:hypothetical protein